MFVTSKRYKELEEKYDRLERRHFTTIQKWAEEETNAYGLRRGILRAKIYLDRLPKVQGVIIALDCLEAVYKTCGGDVEDWDKTSAKG